MRGREARKGGAKGQMDVRSTAPRESPSMNPETGRLSATHASIATKVAESQNGKMEVTKDMKLVHKA
ncbi:MAG: hypothetical protein ACTSXJ_05705 [Candidatus Baldrarchaeia archaeon]